MQHLGSNPRQAIVEGTLKKTSPTWEAVDLEAAGMAEGDSGVEEASTWE